MSNSKRELRRFNEAPGLLNDEVRAGWFSKSLVEVEASNDPWLQFCDRDSQRETRN